MRESTRFSRLWQYAKFVGQTPSGKIGIGLTAGFVSVALFAPWLAPYSPTATTGSTFATPSLAHVLGTDDVGSDILSQLIWGTRGSLLVGVTAALISVFLGVGVGLTAGYYGGKPGEVLMRTTDVVLVLPLLPLLIVIASLLPSSVFLVIVVIGVLSWPAMARVIRSQTLTLRARPFVDASRLSGLNDLEIMLKVLLPNMVSLVVLYGVFAAVAAVVVEAGLDFIGLGSIGNLSWGIILYFALGNDALLRGSWWWFLPPGLMMALMGTGFILLGHEVERVMNLRS